MELQENKVFIDSVEMIRLLTAEETCQVLNVHINTLNNYRELGMLNPIKTGKCFMYDRNEILQFIQDYRGMDISNKQKAYESMKAVKCKI